MKTIIVGLNFGKGDFDASMEELHLLVNSAGGDVCAAVTGTRTMRIASYSITPSAQRNSATSKKNSKPASSIARV